MEKVTILFVIVSLLICVEIYCEETLRKTVSFDLKKINRKKLSKFETSGRMLADKDIIIEYEEDSDYFTIALGLGSPEQYFAVQIDTTTSISWVPSIKCINCNSTSKYNASYSQTSQETNQTIKINDQDGDVEGFGTFDKVIFVGLRADDYGFMELLKYEENYYNDYEDGKLGLGYRTKYGDKFSILDTLKNNGIISKKIFSLSETNFTHGKLHIGDFPEEYFQNSSSYSYCNITSTDELHEDYHDSWTCDISHLLIGKAENFSDANEITSGKVIFDSAYSYISVPQNYLSYFKKILIQKSNNLKCVEVSDKIETGFICTKLINSNSFEEIDDINFILGGFAYIIKAETIFESIDGKQFEFLIKFRNEYDNIWIFGHPFISQFMIVFNAEEDKIGFIGGNKVNFEEEWNNWLSNNNKDLTSKIFYLIIGAAIVGALLFIILLFIIVHSLKRRRLEEQGPLIHEIQETN